MISACTDMATRLQPSLGDRSMGNCRESMSEVKEFVVKMTMERACWGSHRCILANIRLCQQREIRHEAPRRLAVKRACVALFLFPRWFANAFYKVDPYEINFGGSPTARSIGLMCGIAKATPSITSSSPRCRA